MTSPAAYSSSATGTGVSEGVSEADDGAAEQPHSNNAAANNAVIFFILYLLHLFNR
jgi:hypothetical protein